MMKYLLNESKGYFKANMHCHTTCSDGKLTPEEIKEAYMAKGYSIVAYTDHEHVIDQSHLTDESFLALVGCEVAIKEKPDDSTLRNHHMRVAHLSFFALNPKDPVTPCYNSVADHFVTEDARGRFTPDGEYQRRYTPEGISDIIKRAHEMGYLVSYNHPSWSLVNSYDYLDYEGIDFVEIYNTGCVKEGHVNDEHVFEDMLLTGMNVFCIAGDDNHNKTPLDSPSSDSFGGYIMINEEKLEYSAIMKALWQGRFYVSTGADILSIKTNGTHVKITTSGAASIHMRTRGRRSQSVFAEDGKPLTEATFPLQVTDGYYRFKVVATDGSVAYSQAYPVSIMSIRAAHLAKYLKNS